MNSIRIVMLGSMDLKKSFVFSALQILPFETEIVTGGNCAWTCCWRMFYYHLKASVAICSKSFCATLQMYFSLKPFVNEIQRKYLRSWNVKHQQFLTGLERVCNNYEPSVFRSPSFTALFLSSFMFYLNEACMHQTRWIKTDFLHQTR